MTARWQLSSVLGLEEIGALYEGTVWQPEAERFDESFLDAVLLQDRGFLDGEVPEEMVVYGAAKTGTVVYRSEDGWLRTVARPGAMPVPLAWVVAELGGSAAEELMEKSMFRAKNRSL
ncbi:MAG: hypothetical protein GY698_21920 [Actinomycetia bacterium]|nr:hypothetical protein [Actinomycetes bacterium]